MNPASIVNKSFVHLLFFPFDCYKCEISNIQECTSFGEKMLKIASASAGAPPRARWGAYDAPRPPSREGLLAFGNRSFAPSALALYPIFLGSVPQVIDRFLLCF